MKTNEHNKYNETANTTCAERMHQSPVCDLSAIQRIMHCLTWNTLKDIGLGGD